MPHLFDQTREPLAGSGYLSRFESANRLIEVAVPETLQLFLCRLQRFSPNRWAITGIGALVGLGLGGMAVAGLYRRQRRVLA